MGNNGSRSENVAPPRQPIESDQQWAHSFPRNQPRVYKHKVLPERQIDRKLRSTNNGDILHSGGTLTGRSYQQTLSLEREDKSFRIFRASSVSPNSSNEFAQTENRSYIPRRGGANRYAAQRYEYKNNEFQEQVKRFGSEPDLRISQSRADKFKGKQKYKAPSPPNVPSHEQSDLNSYKWSEAKPAGIMRARLFKTNAELKKKYSSPKSKHIGAEILSNVELRNDDELKNINNRYSLPELNKTEFRNELKEVVEKLSYKDDDSKEKLRTLDHDLKRENIKNRLKQMEEAAVSEKEKFESLDNRGQPSGKESTPEKLSIEEKKDAPSKLFYFGMGESIGRNDSENLNYPDKSTVDNFAAKLHSYKHRHPIANSSGSDFSSELEIDETSNNGIALQLRPILPKKQLEIPRFSPAAAWKLLSSVELNVCSSTETKEESPDFLEERIEKLSRPPPPAAIQPAARSTYDKSGDSGISGDAGPTCFDECLESNLQLPLVTRSGGISWTPQQDLGEEESSSDDDRLCTSTVPIKFAPKSNVFSLSLPRDNQLSSYKYYAQSYAGLQKLKRSVSGVLGTLAKRETLPSNCREQSENWFLSKSAPNSLNNGLNSLEAKNFQNNQERGRSSQNVSRVMYLPELDKANRIDRRQRNTERSKSAERFKNTFELNRTSKSYENISAEHFSSSEPEDLQDPPKKMEIKIYKPKRFTFQSTIRQIERRRLAEKLSREAERKEKQRLSELQAMQRVEEEFQRKRAREKASIRQQLRLFTLDEATGWSSLPPNLQIQKDVPVRSDPDGAVSSPTSSPILTYDKSKLTPIADSHQSTKKAAMTQILSEYRQPQRDYKDFRGSPAGYGSKFNDSQFCRQITTIHPQVTCDMPKVSAHKVEDRGSSNYRKQFAHGVKSNKSSGSTYSDDSQTDHLSPNTHHNKRITITRF